MIININKFSVKKLYQLNEKLKLKILKQYIRKFNILIIYPNVRKKRH